MRAFVLALAASCTMMIACVQQPGGDLPNGSGAGGTGGTGGGTGATGGGGSGGSGNGGSMSAAQTYFEESVSPIMDADCSSCHSAQYAGSDMTGGPDFMGNAKPDYYQSLMACLLYTSPSPRDS